MFGILSWIVFGLIVSAIAKRVMPGRNLGGFIVTILLSIAGAALDGFLGRTAGWYGAEGPAGFLLFFGSAILLLWLYRLFLARRA
jgi:uncharacterized membrane protein YeaQ/YmgE (transglycosylase-associated protein family)